MKSVLQMALKDLKILSRDKMGAFFIVGFPILMGLFFGLMMGGFSSGGRSAMKIAIVDQDQSEISRKFVQSLSENKNLSVDLTELEPAKESVRKGTRVGLLIVPQGFGETAGVFWEKPPEIQLGMDPSRSAEAGMMQGFVMEAIGSLVGERFKNPAQFKSSIDRARQQVKEAPDINALNRQLLLGFFGSVNAMLDQLDKLPKQDGENGGQIGAGNFQFANIQPLDISRTIEPGSQESQLKKLKSRWDISFPQAMMWGVLGCVAGFSSSIVRETTLGTMTRLLIAPIAKWQILAGKATACFLTVVLVVALLTTLGVLLPNGLRPNSYPLLAVATICVAVCFVGIMMAFSVLGRTEQSVSGVGWAINMVMAMLGGAMIPVMFMPSFMQPLSFVSPIKWGILAIEGAIWRQFSFQEMLLPCGILLAVGLVGFAIGTTVMNRRE
jgi:ABC-2 type transport system permease protein